MPHPTWCDPTGHSWWCPLKRVQWVAAGTFWANSDPFLSLVFLYVLTLSLQIWHWPTLQSLALLEGHLDTRGVWWEAQPNDEPIKERKQQGSRMSKQQNYTKLGKSNTLPIWQCPRVQTACAIPRKCQPGTSPNLALGIQWTIFPEPTLHRSSMNICHQRSPIYWGWNHRRNSSYWTMPSPLMSTLLANGRLSSPPR